MNVLRIDSLSKSFGKTRVLNSITQEFKGGKIYGIVGENGQGKTVLYKTLSGLIEPSHGIISYNGKTWKESSPNIGLVMDEMNLFGYMTAKENLRFLSEIHHQIGLPQIEEALQRVGLDPFDTRKYKKYSLGMKHRTILAQAIMETPDFLFLDESTNGLDENGVALFHKIVREEADRGAVVFLTSHVKSDLSEIVDTIYELSQGKLTECR